MNKKLNFLFALLFISGIQLSAQGDTVSLMQCIRSAKQHALINSQYGILEDISELKMANARSTNLPSLSAYGKATYQSDAISMSLPGGLGIEIDPFQYNAGIEIDQKLFDGGMASKSRRLESSVLEAETGKINTELYQLAGQVTDLFFQALLLEKKSGIISLKEDVLQKRINELQSAYENGVVKRNDLEKMKAENLIVQQQKVEIERAFQQIVSSLRILTGLDIRGGLQLTGADSLFMIAARLRPEKQYYDAEISKLENLSKLQQAKNLPKLYAYGQAGYSYPGLNFYENQSDYYYIIGAKLSWTIFDWKQNRREVDILRKQQESIAVRHAEFDQKMSMAMANEQIAQEQLQKLIKIDQEIILQRSAVTLGSEMALENGTITLADYLDDLNTEMKARADAETHKLEFLRSAVQLKLLEGIDMSAL